MTPMVISAHLEAMFRKILYAKQIAFSKHSFAYFLKVNQGLCQGQKLLFVFDKWKDQYKSIIFKPRTNTF